MTTAESIHCELRTCSSPSEDWSPELTPSARSSNSSNGFHVPQEADSFELRTILPRNETHPEECTTEDDAFLPASRRASVDLVQSYELYTPDEHERVLKKLDRRLVLFMALLYFLSFLDRSTEQRAADIGNARIAGLNDDLNLSSLQYEWLLWAFYITYIAFEWMTLMYRLVPPHVYISVCILSWGIIASLQAVATSFGFLVVLRALLGIGEAAFGPGVPFYLSFFFQRNELALRTGLFISASPLSASFTGVLAYIITKVGEHGPVSPWRLLFLLEGFPSVLIAVWAWDFIPDGPGVIRWLSPREREVAVLRLRQEQGEKDGDINEEKYQTGRQKSRVNMREVMQTLKDPKCYLTAFMFFFCNVAFSSMPIFQPTIIRDMGYSSITAEGLSAPPYLFAFGMVLATAYFSDRLQSRSSFIMINSAIATLGYGTIAVYGYFESTATLIRYLSLFPATAGFFSAITIIITWTINNQETDSQKGTGMAVLNLIGQMGPLVGTSVFPRSDGPFYTTGMSICAVCMLLVGVLAAILRLVLKRENRKTRESAKAEYFGRPSDEDYLVAERDRTFVFML